MSNAMKWRCGDCRKYFLNRSLVDCGEINGSDGCHKTVCERCYINNNHAASDDNHGKRQKNPKQPQRRCVECGGVVSGEDVIRCEWCHGKFCGLCYDYEHKDLCKSEHELEYIKKYIKLLKSRKKRRNPSAKIKKCPLCDEEDVLFLCKCGCGEVICEPCGDEHVFEAGLNASELEDSYEYEYEYEDELDYGDD